MSYYHLKGHGGFLRLGARGPGISWTCSRPLFSERNGYTVPFMRLFGYRFFWLQADR